LLLLLISAFGVLQVARGQTNTGQDGEVVLNSEAQDGNIREISVPAASAASTDLSNQPLIGFIDSPTAACVQPDPAKDECFINWYYMAVTADPNYMITMTVKLNDFGFVGRFNGFFQNSMYVPHSMNPQGYKVSCGALNSGGNPSWGEAYAYTIRAVIQLVWDPPLWPVLCILPSPHSRWGVKIMSYHSESAS
jgi:hypothetical protein